MPALMPPPDPNAALLAIVESRTIKVPTSEKKIPPPLAEVEPEMELEVTVQRSTSKDARKPAKTPWKS